jgi:hypothetical protein
MFECLLESHKLVQYQSGSNHRNNRSVRKIVNKEMVNIAAEFAVASELCRRNIYVKPILKNLKRTDLLILSKNGNQINIEVKGKQSSQWPNCRGISDKNSILVLVDFEEKLENERPDFYVLTFTDWIKLVRKEIKKYPEQNVIIDKDSVPVWMNQVKNGKPYKGIGIPVENVYDKKNKWYKIINLLE